MALRLALEHSLRAADRVITVSNSVRNEILERYPDTSISVVYNGLDAGSFAECDKTALSTVRQRYGLESEFLLAVGHFEPRKNYSTLVDAVSHLLQRGTRIQLVIIGNDSGGMPSVKQKVAARNLDNQVKILSNLADQEVRCIYNLATLFVFPSSYEGFGIPILEAMAANCPMVLSDIPVFQEITEGKGHYFPCNDALAMADAIDGVLTSPTEMSRLIQYGAERIKNFSFRNISSDLEQVYATLE
jgi:glycosyltransferase involved in cell wall biosynthesis